MTGGDDDGVLTDGDDNGVLTVGIDGWIVAGKTCVVVDGSVLWKYSSSQRKMEW